MYQVLPMVFGAVGMGIILVLGNANGGGSSPLVLLLGSSMLLAGSAVVSIMLYRSQRATFRHTTRQRVQLYDGLLHSTRDRLEDLLSEQRELLLDKDPDPFGCTALVDDRAARLWERSPADADFLWLRVGLGAQPSSVVVSAPRESNPLVPDPLIGVAAALADWANHVWGVPVSLPLGDGRSSGVCGPRSVVLDTVRSMVLQLATHHAPDEVKLVALFDNAEAPEWAWLRWLPHVWSDNRLERYLASTPEQAAALSKRLEEVLGRRGRMAGVVGASRNQSRAALPIYVFLVAEPRLAESMPLLADLTDGTAEGLGASCLFLAVDSAHLPRACRSILEVVGTGAEARLIHPSGEAQQLTIVDAAPRALAEHLAASLAPLRARRMGSPSALPLQLPLLELFGVETVEELDVFERWQRGTPDHSLSVPIGLRPGGEVLRLDLHQAADGPHGLVAGSTGSGKSALLQAVLLGLATTFHPHDLAIVLVDYKGGSMAGPLRELPHLVGIISNLDGNLARRALVALQAEIERRQAVLVAAECDDLDTYLARRRAGQALDPVPHLVLVVDEFAELKTERPDFIHQLVRTARVGRNVGLHLILATQKPRLAVDDEIWANSRFRICLRVEQPQDSNDVLKRPDAASLTVRGQGYLQVGHDELFTLFQGAWGGAEYRPDIGSADPHEIAAVGLDGTRTSLGHGSRSIERPAGPTQADVLVRCLRQTADRERIPALPPVWLPAMAERVILADLLSTNTGWDGADWRPTPRWVAPVIGLVDDPAHRRVEPLRLDFPQLGNLVVYGAPGAGKTTLLQTLAISLATEHTPADVQLYLLDFGGQMLASLAPLPHVGGVVLGDEEEKLVRLMRHLTNELARRKALFGEAGVATLPAYRSSANNVDLNAIVVLIDNLPALLHTFPDLEDQVAQVAQQGGTLGVHMAITATSPTQVRLRIINSFGQALTLRLADRTDYGSVLRMPEGYEPSALSGRGLAKGRPTLEYQAALPAGGDTEADQTAAVRQLGLTMNRAWPGARPWQVRTLPEHVPLLELLASMPPSDGAPVAVVGLGVDELEPLTIDLRDGPHFLIAGPPRGGKSTLLHTLLLALAAAAPNVRLYLIGAGGEEPTEAPGFSNRWETYDASELSQLLDIVEATVDPSVTQVLAVDDLDSLKRSAGADALQRLSALIRRRRGNVHVIVVGTSTTLGASYDGVGSAIKESQTGFLVGGSAYEDLQILGINVPHAEASLGLPPGRGFYARRKRYVRIKVAEPPNLAASAPFEHSPARSSEFKV